MSGAPQPHCTRELGLQVQSGAECTDQEWECIQEKGTGVQRQQRECIQQCINRSGSALNRTPRVSCMDVWKEGKCPKLSENVGGGGEKRTQGLSISIMGVLIRVLIKFTQ